MTVEKWQQRLEDNFTVGDIIGGHLIDVIALEKDYGQHVVSTFHGRSVLMDSFQSFFIETLLSAEEWTRVNELPAGRPYYSTILVYFLTVFRSFRACQVLFLSGYPLDGFSLIRDIKDRAFLLCAIAHNLTTFEAVTAINKGERMKEERRVFSLLVGEDSGLSQEDRDEIAKWQSLFNTEIHGSMLTFVTEIRAVLQNGQPLSPAPLPDDRSIAMYMNRAVELGWMFTRLLPFLQPIEGAFGAEWGARRLILD
ncbi:MAG: hypothetical protein PF636_07400, partial [Actinomycetota bacterium]|nr:hypothetical protein [Actinomycetota bacterium]